MTPSKFSFTHNYHLFNEQKRELLQDMILNLTNIIMTVTKSARKATKRKNKNGMLPNYKIVKYSQPFHFHVTCL